MMKRLILAAGLLLAFTVAPATASAAGGAYHSAHSCKKTFTLKMFSRAAAAAYSGTDLPPQGTYGRLWRYAECIRPPGTTRQALSVWKLRHHEWEVRRDPPMNTAYASDYDDAGQHCCGVYATYGIADCGSYASAGTCLPQGTRVEVCYRGCVVATIDDHGPYVPNRDWDLSLNTASAVGFGGLGTVSWRLLR